MEGETFLPLCPGLGSILDTVAEDTVSLSYLRYTFRHFYLLKKYLKYLNIPKIQPFCVSVCYLRHMSKVSSPTLPWPH